MVFLTECFVFYHKAVPICATNLGECIGEIAKHLALRARFYDQNISTEETFKALIDQQVKVNELLDNVREALFKSAFDIPKICKVY